MTLYVALATRHSSVGRAGIKLRGARLRIAARLSVLLAGPALPPKFLDPAPEHVFAVDAGIESGLTQRDGRKQGGWRRTVPPVAEQHIGVDRRIPNEVCQLRRFARACVTHRVVGARRQPFGQGAGRRRCGFDAECLRQRGPQIRPVQDVTVADVEGCIARLVSTRCPGEGGGEQARVDHVDRTAGAPRKAKPSPVSRAMVA